MPKQRVQKKIEDNAQKENEQGRRSRWKTVEEWFLVFTADKDPENISDFLQNIY